MSALIVGDVHISDKPPTSRTPAYTEQILDKIEFCAQYALGRNIPLVFAGDVFHLKAPTKNSHRLVQRVHEALLGVQTFIVPGNHDMSGDRLDSLDSQPLGSLARMDGVALLLGQTDDLPGIAGIPYLTEFDGGNWHDAVLPWFERAKGADLVVTHAPLFPPGSEPGVYFSIPAQQWANLAGRFAITHTYYGHIHDTHGEFEVNGQTFCNAGALSRGSLHESSVRREPTVTLWTGRDFVRIEVPHEPAREVFLFEESERKAERVASAEAFTQALGSTQLEQLTLEQVTAILRDEVTDPNVLKVIEECLEIAQ